MATINIHVTGHDTAMWVIECGMDKRLAGHSFNAQLDVEDDINSNLAIDFPREVEAGYPSYNAAVDTLRPIAAQYLHVLLDEAASTIDALMECESMMNKDLDKK